MVKASTQYKREHKADYGREKIELLYHDQWIAIINKPSGLLSVPYPGSKVRTAQAVLEELLRKQGIANAKHKPYVVHRLDRDTSGVMMFALTEQAQEKIMNSWHQMVTERLYHAVAEISREAESLPEAGLIDDPLAQNAHNVGFVPKKGDKDKTGHDFKTVAARTHYKMLLQGPTHILFELSLDTGKKNQIRAHLAAHGYPLAGDEEHRAHTDPFNRLCLHARTLEFDHPFTGEHMKFEVPEPAEWGEYVKKGDPHPKKPVWDLPENKLGHSHQSKLHHEELKLGQRRLSAKDKAHMDFIKSGKSYRK
jgi:23S rRNA pseudouridine1911/1915/1917 synthase